MRCEQCEQETRAARMCQIKLLMSSQHSVLHQRTIIGTHAHTTQQPPTKRKHSKRPTGHCTRANSDADQQAASRHQVVPCPLNASGKEVSSVGLRPSGLTIIITTVYSCTVQMRACSRWMRCDVRLGQESMGDKRGDAVSSRSPSAKRVYGGAAALQQNTYDNTHKYHFERKIARLPARLHRRERARRLAHGQTRCKRRGGNEWVW
jgi:hypothetical protein